jgi:hypothetical protein
MIERVSWEFYNFWFDETFYEEVSVILVIGIFHVVICAKYEQGLGLLIASPMIFEFLLLISGLQVRLSRCTTCTYKSYKH